MCNVTVSDPSEQTLTTQVLPLDSLLKNYTPAFSIQPPLPCTIQHYMLPQTHLVRYFLLKLKWWKLEMSVGGRIWTSSTDTSQQFKRFTPHTPGAYEPPGKTHTQCNGFRPEWTNGNNSSFAVRLFAQELQSSVFDSAPITMYHSTLHLTTNTFGSVLLAQTQMVKTRNVTEWPNLTTSPRRLSTI